MTKTQSVCFAFLQQQPSSSHYSNNIFRQQEQNGIKRRGRSGRISSIRKYQSTSRKTTASPTSTMKLYSIISPFDNTNNSNDENDATKKNESSKEEEDYLELTFDNVEMVLDEMRPYLMSDGGNVQISDIDGPIVKLELMGNCGTCPSSTMTMKMGLEKRLKERIPEIEQVVQAVPEGPELTEMGVDSVLDGVRPFLTVAGGSISVVSITGIGSVQPKVLLRMEGSNSSLYSVKLEITQRVLRHFMVPGLRVEFEDD